MERDGEGERGGRGGEREREMERGGERNRDIESCIGKGCTLIADPTSVTDIG